jgi:hypothetical protein
VTAQIEIAVLDADSGRAIDGLADVLVDCVQGGASVSFMPPFGRTDAAAFFEKVFAGVARGATVLAAGRADGRIVGTPFGVAAKTAAEGESVSCLKHSKRSRHPCRTRVAARMLRRSAFSRPGLRA